MKELITIADAMGVKPHLPEDAERAKAILVSFIGGKYTPDGFWRFFSPMHPKGGGDEWSSQWRRAWSLEERSAFPVGEDLFGNQILLLPGRTNTYLCSHEDGSCHDTELMIGDLLESVVKEGVDWLDFYGDGSAAVGLERKDDVDWQHQLHWTTPLILGGAVNRSNVTVMDRMAHLRGHQQLWTRVSGMEPGEQLNLR